MVSKPMELAAVIKHKLGSVDNVNTGNGSSVLNLYLWIVFFHTYIYSMVVLVSYFLVLSFSLKIHSPLDKYCTMDNCDFFIVYR